MRLWKLRLQAPGFGFDGMDPDLRRLGEYARYADPPPLREHYFPRL